MDCSNGSDGPTNAESELRNLLARVALSEMADLYRLSLREEGRLNSRIRECKAGISRASRQLTELQDDEAALRDHYESCGRFQMLMEVCYPQLGDVPLGLQGLPVTDPAADVLPIYKMNLTTSSGDDFGNQEETLTTGELDGRIRRLEFLLKGVYCETDQRTTHDQIRSDYLTSVQRRLTLRTQLGRIESSLDKIQLALAATQIAHGQLSDYYIRCGRIEVMKEFGVNAWMAAKDRLVADYPEPPSLRPVAR